MAAEQGGGGRVPALEDETKLGGPKFNPPLYRQRYDTVVSITRRLQTRKVMDMGCAECKLLRLLRRENYIEELVGVDINSALLCLNENTVQPLTTDFLHPRPKPFVIRLMQGSIADPDARLVDFDLLACIEVIEHLDPPVLQKMPKSIFGILKPKTVVMTTPNAEFNVLFPGFSGFRHADHRFEWTRAEFQSWCSCVCENYPYSVEFGGIGEPPQHMEHVGCCSQMAVFTRLEKYTDKQTEAWMLGTPYEIIAECVHPYEKNPLSREEKLLREAEYYLNVLFRQKVTMQEEDRLSDTDKCESGPPPTVSSYHSPVAASAKPTGGRAANNSSGSSHHVQDTVWQDSDEDETSSSPSVIKIGLEELLKFPRIRNFSSSVDEIRSVLQLSLLIKLDATRRHVIFHVESESRHSESSDDDDGNDFAADISSSHQHEDSHPFSLDSTECWD